jgi:hypothetical protein
MPTDEQMMKVLGAQARNTLQDMLKTHQQVTNARPEQSESWLQGQLVVVTAARKKQREAKA